MGPRYINELKPTEPLSQEWFRQRAIDSLAKTDAGYWDFSDSLLLYAGTGVEEYEHIQEAESPYARLVTKPERAYLESIADAVAAELPDDFDYIDLGPGTEHKEQFVFDALKRAGKTFRYVPVDVSKKFLQLSTDYAQQQGIEAQGIQASFEELAEKLPRTERKRFVSLGLTLSNYEPQTVLAMLKAIAGEGGKVFIDVHMRDRTDMDALQSVYNNDARELIQSKLPFLGLDAGTDISDVETDDGVRVWCTMKNPTPAMQAKGVQPGDRMLMFQSLRYTKESLEAELQQAQGDTGYTMIDTGQPFVGVILEA